MDIAWPLLGLNVMFVGMGWMMDRGARRQRRQLIARRSSVAASSQKEPQPRAVALHRRELHCPHCGHTIGDRDFARPHAPTTYRPTRELPYSRRPPI